MDVQYLANQTSRHGPGRAEVPRLIQVDPNYAFRNALIAEDAAQGFDPEAWALSGAEPSFPVSASYCVADISLPEIRYLADPAKDPLTAVERL